MSRHTENYIIKKGNQSVIIKTDLQESELIKIIKHIEQHENYNQADFLEVIEAIEEELSKVACNYEVVNLNDIQAIEIK